MFRPQPPHSDGRYLVVEAHLPDKWGGIYRSPIGVGKELGSDIDFRVIQYYSYPPGMAINDFTDRCNFSEKSYNPPRDIARRIWELRVRFS